MKIVTWNCNGAFRRKFGRIAELNADIYVIQECENPTDSKHIEYQKWAKNYIWKGDTKNKGIAIFAKPEITLKELNWSNEFKGHNVKHFLPCEINEQFNLLAVWTHRNSSPNFAYMGQFWKYLQINRDKMKNILLIGDFNSNKIWDEWDRWWNHSDVVNELKELGIESFYHKLKEEEQGKESKPTLYFQRKLDRPYHIDYVFGSKEFGEILSKLDVGIAENWLDISDHMPIITEYEKK